MLFNNLRLFLIFDNMLANISKYSNLAVWKEIFKRSKEMMKSSPRDSLFCKNTSFPPLQAHLIQLTKGSSAHYQDAEESWE